jgi:hypothetical protein
LSAREVDRQGDSPVSNPVFMLANAGSRILEERTADSVSQPVTHETIGAYLLLLTNQYTVQKSILGAEGRIIELNFFFLTVLDTRLQNGFRVSSKRFDS